MNKQLQLYIDLLKDGLVLINSYRINQKSLEGIQTGQFLCKYIETIKPVLINVISLVPIDKDNIYNLISLIFKELSICLFNLYEKQPLQEALLEQMFTFSLLAIRLSMWNENDLDEMRKYQSYVVKKIGNDLLKYNGTTFNYCQEKENKIIITMTTCKRFDLFEQTINSFLNSCLDKELISEILVVDDNSSTEDREKMKQLYPYITFIFKDEKNKGHAKSMNIIRNYMISKNYKYQFHLEDDWRFLFKDAFIGKCLSVLMSNNNYGQCLLNKNYSEEDELYKYVGGTLKELNEMDKLNFNNIKYYEHEYYQGTELENKMRENYGRNTCYYWPHFSLRVGITKVDVYKNIGEFNETVSHFEREYAFRYVNKGYITTYLDTLFCRHLGRKTWEINDPTAINAYTLNNTRQFENDIKREIKTKKDNPSQDKLYTELIKMIKDIQLGNNPTNNFNNTLIDIVKNEIKEKQSSSGGTIREVIKLDQSSQDIKNNENFSTSPIQKQDLEELLNIENLKVKEKNYKLKTFVINLERRKDRLDKFMLDEQVKQLNPVIFKAIDGQKIKPTNKILKLFETSDYNYRKGLVGCWCSHIMIWLELLRSNEFNTALILEDDCELSPDFISKLQNVLQKAPFIIDKAIWDIIFLSHHLYPQYKDDRVIFKNEIKLELWDKERSIKENMGGTTSYLITKKGAETLLEHVQNFGAYNGVDWTMFKSSINNKYINSIEEIKGKSLIYYCRPFITKSMNDNTQTGETIDTDIQFDYTTLKIDLKTRLKREIIYWNIQLKCQGYKCINYEKKIESLTYNENSNIILTENIPDRITMLTNIIIYPFNKFEEKMNLIKQIKIYPLVYYTLEDLEIKQIIDPEIEIPLLPVKAYLISVPETKLNDKIKNDIAFECYLNTTFSVEYV